MKKNKSLSKNFCSCIKKVRKTIKSKPVSKVNTKTKMSAKEREKIAIAICVKSVLHTKGKTLKRFTCNPSPILITKRLLTL